MFGSKYITNDSTLWALLWVMEIPLVELRDQKYRQFLLEFAGKFAAPCIAEALMNILDPARKGAIASSKATAGAGQ